MLFIKSFAVSEIESSALSSPLLHNCGFFCEARPKQGIAASSLQPPQRLFPLSYSYSSEGATNPIRYSHGCTPYIRTRLKVIEVIRWSACNNSSDTLYNEVVRLSSVCPVPIS